MYTTETKPVGPAKRSWRRHSDEFKARVVKQANQPHVSIAAVALANGINANMLRRWVRACSATRVPAANTCDGSSSQSLSFVQLAMPVEKRTSNPLTSTAVTTATIDVQIHRGETRVVASLPLSSTSAAWLREVLC